MKQMIPSNTIVILNDRPDLAVYHTLGRDAWVDVQEDGSLLCDTDAPTEWGIYINQGFSLNLETLEPADVEVRYEVASQV